MIATVSNRFDLPAYSYAEAETALARTFGLGLVHQRSLVRTRIKYIQHLGLIDLNLGKKKRATYSFAQVSMWLVALLMMEAGLDPTLIVAALRNNWKNIASTLELATSHEAQSGQFYYLCLWPRVLSGPAAQKPALSIAVIPIRSNLFAPGQDQLRELVAANRDDWICFHDITRALTRLQNNLPRRD